MFIGAPIASILVTLVLYILQGVVLGLSSSVPLYLTSAGATWKQQGTYSFVHYPFSFKLIWAPIIDVFYFRRFGRRQTWLLPIQVVLGIVLIIFSFFIDSLIAGLRIALLTISFFFIIFFTASQDVCVDGWALTLFSTTNVVWQSTSQTIGQTFGRFLGSSFLLTFESANFTNRYIREPLSLQMQNTGLFTLAQFVRFWGIAFLIVTCIVAVLFRERAPNKDDDNKTNLKFIETYLAIIKIFKKKCMLELAFILIISPFGYAATYFMTNIALVK
jgi:PAT family acetyl-CoA transporter-like MFS transporter 1